MPAHVARADTPEDLDLVVDLDREIFVEASGDEPVTIGDATWWLYRDHRGRPAAFCGARVLPGTSTVLLERAGVLEAYRGRALHRRLVAVRLRWARKRQVITYTSVENTASANTLIRSGFVLYRPEWQWAGAEFLYWMRCAR